MKRILTAVGSIAALAGGCGVDARTAGDDGATNRHGLLGEPCHFDGTCQGDLTCRSDVCEDPCPDGNSLGGSMEAAFSMDFDFVSILKRDTAVAIEYVDDIAGGSDKVFKLVIDTSTLNAGSGSTISPSEFANIAVVERVAAAGGAFPPVDQGEVRFGVLELEGGGRACGDFDVSFLDAVGSRATGSFDAIVSDLAP